MNELLREVRSRRDAKQAELDGLLAKVQREQRNTLTTAETVQFEGIKAELHALDERADELEQKDRRQAAAAEVRLAAGGTYGDGTSRVRGSDVYTDAPGSPSFLKDLATLHMRGADSYAAAERLQRCQAEIQETRAGDLASNVTGSGAEFAPPAWLLQDFVSLARPGRVTADLLNAQPLPAGFSSINLPRVASGTEVGVQQTQNTAVTDTAAETDSVSSGIVTFAGKQIASEQLLFQSPGFDKVLLGDLAAAWAAKVDNGVIYGSNANGQLRGLSHTSVAVVNSYTTSTPALTNTSGTGLLNVVLGAGAAVQTSVFKAADALVLHPKRWAWVLGQVDSQGRPLVPSSGSYNAAGVVGPPTAEGSAGTLAGYPVYLDPSIATNLGTSSNQDEVYLVRRDECFLYETAPSLRTFDAPYADQLSILFRCHSYAASIPHRRAGAVQVIRGTGLVLA